MGRIFRIALGLMVLGLLAFGLSWVIYMPDRSERGIWKAQAGNMILSLGPLTAKAYGASSAFCGELYSFPAHMGLVQLAEGATIHRDGDALILSLDGALEPQGFDRIDALPALCTDPAPATARTVFDAMWTAMDEHYAFFDLHGVDWAARRVLAPATDANLAPSDLFALLQQALAGLDDGHIQIGTEMGYFSPKSRPKWLPKDSPLDRATLWQVARQNAGVDLIQLADTPVYYGLRPDGVAYVMITQMDVPQSLGQTSHAAAAALFAPLIDTLSQVDGIVLDLRYNPGGSDAVSFGIASHFTAEPVPVFTKTTRIGDGQSDPFQAVVMPHDDTPVTAPVLLLTSDMTGSAAEIFTLALRDMPQVTTLGEPTSGGLSDILGFALPNGWAFGLSNQTYSAMDGTVYEVIGIPPDVTVPFDAAAFEAGQDPVLAAAFARMAQGASTAPQSSP